VIKRLSRQNVFLLLTATGSMLFALTLSEVTLRLFPDLVATEIQEFIQATPDTYGVSHPYIGHLHKPNNAIVISGRDFRAVHHTDGHGFRNAWPWPERVEIVAVGDSLTFGHGVEDDQAWPALLAKRLPQGSLINLGLSGGGPQQYLRLYETFGTRLYPKLLLVGFFLGNDFANAEWFDQWIKSDAGGNYMVWRDFGRPKRVHNSQSPIKGNLRRLQWEMYLLARKSYLFNLMVHVIEGAKKWRPDEVRIFELPDGGRLELLPSNFKSKIKGAHPGHPQFDLTLDTLKRIRSIADSHGTKMLVIFLPSKEGTYLPLLDSDVPDVSGPMRGELERLGIAYLDLGPAFRDRAAKGEKLFFETDGHPNVNGTL
jgi:GDSL-like Lipase/Acylhydrolase family